MNSSYCLQLAKRNLVVRLYISTYAPQFKAAKPKLVGAMIAAQQLGFSIAFPLRNEAELASLLRRLYDPSSPDYHRFLSVDQFTEWFGPTVEDYQSVVNFAEAHGFIGAEAPANRMVVSLKGTAAQVEQASALQ